MDKDNSMSRNNPSRHSILVTSNINAANDANRLSELCRQLEIRGYRLFQAPSRKVALDFLGNAAHPAGILLLVAEPTGENEAAQLAALDELRQVAPSIPLFLLFRQLRIEQLSSQLLDEAQGCFNLAAGPHASSPSASTATCANGAPRRAPGGCATMPRRSRARR
ncbi:hypothetical protein QK368_08945 [Pseudomonas aeruginosa]|nr:hypothetical protein [Pseudomonas aeruginosa]